MEIHDESRQPFACRLFHRRRARQGVPTRQVRQAITQIADNFAAKRVYAEPCQQQGVTVIPAAEIRGGGGVGSQHERTGGGMGIRARPVGAYVVKDGTVDWKPAFDLSRVVFRGQIVALALLLTIGWLVSRRQ